LGEIGYVVDVSFFLRVATVLSLTLAFAATAGVAFTATAGTFAEALPKPGTAKYERGKKLYRKYCGQCHALKEARAVGFGTGETDKKGVQTDLPGPSFNDLRVSKHLNVLAITGLWEGHDKVAAQMTWTQVYEVSEFVASATRKHKRVAIKPADHF
jgi:mono/diheme cytochrome c family protein